MANTPSRIRRLGGAALTTALTAGLVGLTAPAALAAPEQGHVVLIGGGVEPGNAISEQIFKDIIALAPARADGARPKVAIVTASSVPAENPAEAGDTVDGDNATANGVYYANWFASHNVDTYPVPIDMHPGEDYPGDPYSADNAADSIVADAISDSDIVYFGGGDQTRYLHSLITCAPAADDAFTDCNDTAAMSAIRQVIDRGGVVAGSSAGLAIQQGTNMISGSEPYQSWRDGAAPGSFDTDSLSYIPAGGFGFFSEGLIDSHFARRDRQPRIVRLALDLGQPIAYGVEENTALVVNRATRTGSVIGELGASILDVSDATFDGANVNGVRYSYLTPGSTVDFADDTAMLAGSPTTSVGTEAPPIAPSDIWGSYECEGDIFGTLNLAKALVASSAPRASGDSCASPLESPRFRSTVTRDALTSWNADGGFTDLLYSITEIPSFSITAAADGTPLGTSPVQAADDFVDLAITVTNTGALPLANIAGEFDAVYAAPNGPQGQAPSAPSSQDPLLPGESITLKQHLATAGLLSVSGSVTAAALDTNGVALDIDVAPQSFQGSITTPGPETPTGKPPVPTKPTEPSTPKTPAQLANTGQSGIPSTLALGALLLTGAALTLSRGRRRTR